MIDFILKQISGFTQLDLRQPITLLIYFGVVGMLGYQYSREAGDVFREYGRLYREITKETALRERFTDIWKQRFAEATHMFKLGPWFIGACAILMLQFIGVMVLLQSAPVSTSVVERSSPNKAYAASSYKIPAQISAVYKGDEANGVPVTTVTTARAEAQRLLGFFMIVMCMSISVVMTRRTYIAQRILYEFSSSLEEKHKSHVDRIGI